MVAKHLRLDIIGDYVPSTLVGEIWQTSIRLALVFGPGTVDDVGTLPDNWDPVADPISRTETDWTITSNWTVDGPSIGTWDPGDYLNDQAGPAVAAFIAGAGLSNQVRVRRLRIWPIGSPLGRAVPAVPYATGTAADLEWTGSYPIGNQSSTQLPPQNSPVVSLRTLQIGSAGRGRMFLPSMTSAALSGAKIASTPLSDLADVAQTFVQDLAVASTPFVYPIVTGGNFTKYAVVKRVKVGNVMDTQRRRRNAIAETYQERTI